MPINGVLMNSVALRGRTNMIPAWYQSAKDSDVVHCFENYYGT
jgi:hypothetical protein